MTDSGPWKIKSEVLEQMILVTQVAPGKMTVDCADGAKYTSAEVKLLQQAGTIDPRVHIVKKLFGGTIIQIGNNHIGD